MYRGTKECTVSPGDKVIKTDEETQGEGEGERGNVKTSLTKGDSRATFNY